MITRKAKLLIALMFAGMLQTLTAHSQVLADVFGNPVKPNSYVEVEGSPYYFKEGWHPAVITLSDKSVIKDVDLKFDIVEDKLYFKAQNGETMSFTKPVREFTFNVGKDVTSPAHFKNGYNGIPDFSFDAYFEVLAEGKAQLLKKVFKKVAENKMYGSATITKTFVENVRYYIVTSTATIQIKNDKKSVLLALPDKKDLLEAYIKENNLNLKKDTDLTKLITYYNSI
ncbi:hypothetical protein [Mucilaginibacter sp. PAMB04168]|uniref:hypothetical protein n=1 Tax=Mucilaginibacter sp. PAMB04168 TaxID=3138567 RepID=UPI0031F65B0B